MIIIQSFLLQSDYSGRILNFYRWDCQVLKNMYGHTFSEEREKKKKKTYYFHIGHLWKYVQN